MARRKRRGHGGRRGPNATNLFTHLVKDAADGEPLHCIVRVIRDGPRYLYLTREHEPWTFPYRDFAFEYPPAALPAMLVPSYMSWSYATSFAVLMGACGAGCIALVASALREVEAGAAHQTNPGSERGNVQVVSAGIGAARPLIEPFLARPPARP